MAELQTVKTFLDSDAGTVLRDRLNFRLDELSNIEAISEKDTPTHQAIEVKAQKRAHAKLKEILSDIMTLGGEVNVKNPKDSFHCE